MSTESPKTPFSVIPRKWPLWGTVVAGVATVALGIGIVAGSSALGDYRASVEAAQTQTQTAADTTTDNVQRAQDYADAAQEAADAAAVAVTAAEAAEAAAAAQVAADAAAAAAAEAAAEAAKPGSGTKAPSGPTKCPAGTVANAVDDDGNESNCQPPCSAYDDNNVCVGAPSPGYREDNSL